MFTVRWQGAAPSRSRRAALRAAGVQLAQNGPVVVFGPRPRPPGGEAWLWVSPRAVQPAAAREAVLAGAYAVLWHDDPGFVAALAARVAELAVSEPAPPEAQALVSQSAAARRVLAQLAHAARTSMPVLLLGETGVGKDVAARLVHDWSARRDARFVAINCAAIPDHLIEAELFGYTRGAFSGAVRDYDGQLSAAAGGTVFLDEIDETPPTLQVKLLRVLEDRVVSRLGENVWRELDFRIVAASNRDLHALIDRGSFGADLYERLAIVEIALPPLRERLEDLPALVRHFIARFYAEEPAARTRGAVHGVSRQALHALGAYAWPGNVRELRNAVFETLVHKRAGDEILLSDLPRRILHRSHGGAVAGLVDEARLERLIDGGRFDLKAEIARLEALALRAALARAGHNAAAAARLLGGVGRGRAADPGSTVRAMMRRLGVTRAD